MKKEKKTGKEFELLIEEIFKNLVKNPEFEKVEHNIKLEGKDGPRQIDVLVSNEVVGFKFLTVIECRDYNIKLPISHIDGFHSKLQDVNANKGVLISKLGFSSKAISKAKRLGITLCTVQEVSDPSWNPTENVQILIEEIQANEFKFSGEFNSPGDLNFKHKTLPVINGINMINLINKKWKDGSLSYINKSITQNLLLHEIKPPYIIRSTEGVLVEINDFKLSFKPEINYFLSSLSELKNTKVLKDVTSQKTTIFLDISSITDINFKYKKVPRTILENFNGIIVSIRVLTELNENPDEVLIERLE